MLIRLFFCSDVANAKRECVNAWTTAVDAVQSALVVLTAIMGIRTQGALVMRLSRHHSLVPDRVESSLSYHLLLPQGRTFGNGINPSGRISADPNDVLADRLQ